MAKNYTRELKLKICEFVVKDNIKIQTVAEKFNLNLQMVYRWVEEYNLLGEEAFCGKGRQRPEDSEKKKLLKELEMLRQENEILKKAAAYFAKPKQND